MLGTLKESALKLKRDGLKVRRLVAACKQLLSERGEALGVSLAAETLALYAELSNVEQVAFFEALKTELAPQPARGVAHRDRVRRGTR